MLLDTVSTTRPINSTPLNATIGHHPNGGQISYGYEYDDRPSNCIAGARTETITITDNNPTDLFANLTVLGRAAGPILQDLGTRTAATRELSIEAVFDPVTMCPTSGNAATFLAQRPDSAINEIVDDIEENLESTYSQVFRTQDQSTWNPKDGRLSVNVAWTYQNCS